jgi:hypothetical protein
VRLRANSLKFRRMASLFSFFSTAAIIADMIYQAVYRLKRPWH